MKVIPVEKKKFLSNFLSKGIPVPFWAQKKGTGKRNMHPRAASTEYTAAAIEQILDYVATYPNDGILFRKSDMILAAHADAGFLNESRARRRAGANILLSENEPKPKLNGPILTMAQIIKTVMALAAEAEIAALFITAEKMIPLRNTLIEMGWPQPQTQIKTDNSTAVGFTNKTIVKK